MLKQLLRGLRSPTRAQPAPAGHGPAGPRELPPLRYSYAADGLATVHNADFLQEPRFRESYALGAASGHRICAPEDLHIEWRVYVCCWAACHACHLAGDFVECGVSTGITARAVAHYVDLSRLDRKLWLFDTFAGIPDDQMQPNEAPLARSKNARHYFDSFELVRGHFAGSPNVHLVRGPVPDTLPTAAIERVAWLHIDMNIVYPEVAASAHFWERLTPGAIVIYDDYASQAHVPQKRALDAFAAERGVRILSLPTGQGLLIKP
jgi:hypothetical protein